MTQSKQPIAIDEVWFGNHVGFKKAWGSPQPPALHATFRHLAALGYHGPISWSNALQIPFEKPTHEDIVARIVIGRVGEFPAGTFNFDTTILICSTCIGVAEKEINLWGPIEDVIQRSGSATHAPVLSVTLSHLKWNKAPGPNPTWRIISNSTQNDADDWVATWDSFGEPFVNTFTDLNILVDGLLCQDFVPRSSWVKSDGVRSAARIEYAAILLFYIGKNLEAADLLNKKINESKKMIPSHATQLFMERCKRILEWGTSNTA